MSTKNSEKTNGAADKPSSRCLPIAQEGIETSQQLARYLSALMSDVVEGTIPASVANAGVNAAGKLLKVVEMQHKYGTPGSNGRKTLNLCGTENDTRLIEENRKAEESKRAEEIAALEERLAQLKSN